jgi:hypothetical protein
MMSFVVWNMSTAGDGKWKNVEAEDARSAAELVCGSNLRSFGLDNEICARVRALDSDDDAVLFYAEKKKSSLKSQKKPELASAGL